MKSSTPASAAMADAAFHDVLEENGPHDAGAIHHNERGAAFAGDLIHIAAHLLRHGSTQ
jgi:hypothetical protein